MVGGEGEGVVGGGGAGGGGYELGGGGSSFRVFGLCWDESNEWVGIGVNLVMEG